MNEVGGLMVHDPVTVLAAVVVTLLGLLGYCVRAILSGRLVPRSHLVDAQRERDKLWDVAVELMGQNSVMLEGTRTTAAVLRAVQEAAQNREVP